MILLECPKQNACPVFVYWVGLLILIAPIQAQEMQHSTNTFAEGENGAIATGSQQAADIGLQILKDGGNAIDAAVATMLVQTVVEADLFCFGSEVPIMVYDKQRNVVEVIVGLGAAPRLATAEWFNANRNGLIQGRGDIANCNVPGTLDALLTALDRYGTRTFEQCAQGMLTVLQERANTDPATLKQSNQRRNFDATGWVEHHQNFLSLIERLVAAEKMAGPDRRVGLRAVSDYFYRGPIALEIDAWSRANGGLIRYTDMALHHSRIESPRQMEFEGHTVFKCGVWTQGPFFHQTLRLLEGHDLRTLKPDSADYIHLITESMKLAFADRDAFYGDPDFVHVPIDALVSDQYRDLRRQLIDMQHASQTQQPGDPFQMKPLLGVAPQDHKVFAGYSNDTSNCLVADQWGNVVAATPSGWGGIAAGNTGVQLGSRMIGLVTWKDHPSMVEPGKRPRITLTPTLVFKDGRPVFAISVAGGDQQDQASIQVLLNHLVFNMDPKLAVTKSRFGTEHHINWFGHGPAVLGSLILPRDTEQNVVDNLTQRGHKIRLERTASSAVVLAIDPATGKKQAATDGGKFAVAY